jgi:YfiH family protein
VSLDPFYADREHLAIELPGARALFTTRRGGCSAGPFTSLNLGRFTDDRPEDVGRNRARLAERLDVGFADARQVHGTTVRRVTRSRSADVAVTPEEGDGVATALPGVAPMVLTADCLPIAVAGGGAVAMLHGGWRGLAAGIVGEGVLAVRGLGGAGALSAAIGPGAGACCYEVGDEVHAAFADYDAALVHRGQNLDLKAIARLELERAGVAVVHDIGLCTICGDPSLFYSHRRDRGVTGRQAGLVWLS